MELEDIDIMEKVEGQTCVSPIVIVPKQKGDIRICMDIRMELHQHVINPALLGVGCTGCQNISDDIVVYGKDVAKHDEKLRKVVHTL